MGKKVKARGRMAPPGVAQGDWVQMMRYGFTVNRDSSGTWKNLPAKHPNHPSDEMCRDVLEKCKARLLKEPKKKGKVAKKRKREDNGDGNGNSDGDMEPKKKKRK